MKIWLVRHGRTALNANRLMQGRTDEPLNEQGRRQAAKLREMIGSVTFDAVYASPLIRSQQTASIISGWPEDQIKVDPRLIEVDFGPYEGKKYTGLGLQMSLFWLCPEIFPAPKGVESVRSMVERSRSFIRELRSKPYENVLIVAHGGILRALNGCLLGRKKGIQWRPHMHNCEAHMYEMKGNGFVYRGKIRPDCEKKKK